MSVIAVSNIKDDISAVDGHISFGSVVWDIGPLIQDGARCESVVVVAGLDESFMSI